MEKTFTVINHEDYAPINNLEQSFHFLWEITLKNAKIEVISFRKLQSLDGVLTGMSIYRNVCHMYI